MIMRPAIVGLLALVLGAPPTMAEEGAWDRSVALEIKGQLAEAERVMVRAHGEHPENYWAGLRLAYLALLQGRYPEARSRYQSLRQRPEAAGDADVVHGLASAMVGEGWAFVNQGDTAQARAAFREALKIDPGNQSAAKGLAATASVSLVLPEIWSGATGNSLGRDKWTGWANYAQVAVTFSDWLTARVTGRFVHYWNTGPQGRGASQNGRLSSYNLDEEFVGVAHESRWWGAELVGARSDTDQDTAILGGAGRLRLGGPWGATLEGARHSAKGGPGNTQVRPMAYLWMGDHLGLQAGARLTWDDRGNGVSGNAGLSLLFGSWSILMEGHVGDEFWSFGFAGPSIMSFAAKTTYGGCTTVLWSLSKKMRLALQGEGERLRQEGASGFFWSFSTGIQLNLGAQ
jgi:hypothetical protein